MYAAYQPDQSAIHRVRRFYTMRSLSYNPASHMPTIARDSCAELASERSYRAVIADVVDDEVAQTPDGWTPEVRIPDFQESAGSLGMSGSGLEPLS
jgi:hypothetical protein